MASNHYHATKWVFGERTLGLRLLAWIAEHSTSSQKSIFILGFALMRRDGNILLPSTDIAKNALTAGKIRHDSVRLKEIAETDLYLKKLFTPKVLRLALSDKGQFEIFLNNIKKVKLSVNRV